jgi:site-specific recombinase XerD
VRGFSPATVRTYAFHLLSFLRFEQERDLDLVRTVPTDIFDFIEWLGARSQAGVVVPITRAAGAAPSTMNQRIAAVRGLFDYAVLSGIRTASPVPSSRRSTGLVPKPRGLLGISARAVAGEAEGTWSNSLSACPRLWSRLMCRTSWPTSTPTVTGP